MAKSTSKINSFSKADLMQSFITYSLENDKFPENFYLFAKFANCSEKDLYQHFSSVQSVDDAIWVYSHESTVTLLESSSEWAQYSAREKTLAYFYAWIENLLENRSYVLLSMSLYEKKNKLIPTQKPTWLNQQKSFFAEIVAEGIQSGEIENRKLISDNYADAFTMASLFVLKCWKNDQSVQFQKTDQAIEKSIRLLFDFIGKSPLDSILDFGKFFLTQKPF
jgi:hypothetical protein